MTRLLISAGNGPAECRLAVGHILRRMAEEGPLDVVEARADQHGPASAIVTLPESRAALWRGTILWRCQSPLRPAHRRKNWFVGVFGLTELALPETHLRPQDLRFERFRAGGPGGQHQNTTDSAVRVVHLPSGLTAAARDGRSQHRNKVVALARLKAMLDLAEMQAGALARESLNRLHRNLARGRPDRVFSGVKFREGGRR